MGGCSSIVGRLGRVLTADLFFSKGAAQSRRVDTPFKLVGRQSEDPTAPSESLSREGGTEALWRLGPVHRVAPASVLLVCLLLWLKLRASDSERLPEAGALVR